MAETNRTDAPARAPQAQEATPAQDSAPTQLPPLDGGEERFQLLSLPQPKGRARGTPVPAPERLPQHRRWPVVAGLLLLLVLLGVAVWWLTTSAWTPPWVQPVEPLTASGTLEADEVLVGSQVAGRIVELVQEGQTVQANDLVARLDDALIQIQIQQGDLAARQRLEIQAEQYQLRAPISGVVTRVPMHSGEVVSPGQTVAAIANLSELKLTAYILERDLGQVQVGQQVTVTVDPFPERTFHGVVISTNPRAEFTPRNVQTRADRLNLVFGVNVRVENPDGALKPGMPADVAFPPLP